MEHRENSSHLKTTQQQWCHLFLFFFPLFLKLNWESIFYSMNDIYTAWHSRSSRWILLCWQFLVKVFGWISKHDRCVYQMYFAWHCICCFQCSVRLSMNSFHPLSSPREKLPARQSHHYCRGKLARLEVTADVQPAAWGPAKLGSYGSNRPRRPNALGASDLLCRFCDRLAYPREHEPLWAPRVTVAEAPKRHDSPWSFLVSKIRKKKIWNKPLS